MKSGSKLGRKYKKQKKIAKGTLKPKTGTTSLESIFLTLFISLTVLMLAGALFVFQQLQGKMSDSIDQSKRLLVESYAQQIEQTMKQYIDVMDLTVKEPGLVYALRNKDEELLHKRESLLAYMFPAALRIRILPPEFDQPDNSINPPISYSCLDLLHKSRTGDSSIVEIHLLGKPEQHIDIARNIRDNNNVALGNLLLTLPVQTIKQAFKQMKATDGLLELQQTNSMNRNGLPGGWWIPVD